MAFLSRGAGRGRHRSHPGVLRTLTRGPPGLPKKVRQHLGPHPGRSEASNVCTRTRLASPGGHLNEDVRALEIAEGVHVHMSLLAHDSQSISHK
eukprot:9170297-Pyramimonas_sp.AAC.1